MTPMNSAKKITIAIPVGLLRKAQAFTGQGITPTIRKGLELLASGPAYEGLRRLRGKLRFSIDLKQLREDS
ncbi:MAG: hypothetical protein HY543_11390 [Deltaproteobacteria bacterium]|nr:hypothetical protein [Deltaproteobacteria bacterium]